MPANSARSDLHVVAVTGGRKYADRAHVFRVLDEIHAVRKIDLLVHGGCTGADALAKRWARSRGVFAAEIEVSPEMWQLMRKSAGPARNRIMLVSQEPNLLVAFPGGTGTTGCVAIAESLGIEVRRYE